MANVKINKTKLAMEITSQDRRDSKKKWYNIHALPLMLQASDGVTDTRSFMDAFTPTRENNSIAKKLGLGLDVQRGRWVMKEQVINEALDGAKLIELLIQALQEGDTVRFNEYANKLLSCKVSECLADQRKLLAGQMVEGAVKKAGVKEVHDLVKNMNTDQNLEPEDNAPEPEEQPIPNLDLVKTAAEDDQDRNFEEGSESDRLDTFRERANSKSKSVVQKGRSGTKQVCPPGFKMVDGKCVRMSADERVGKERAAVKGARARKGESKAIARKRERSLHKRNNMGM